MNALSSISLAGSMEGTAPEAARAAREDPGKVGDAARQFEALLIGQMLREVREHSGGWLGSGEDAAGSCATELAEQQFARALAERGGLGLATLITRELETGPGPAD